jgi:VIT1/CCC1 family predicted Fe2+/Mn2+ transporter
MMTEELGYGIESGNPLRAAASTFAAFVVVGAVPLAVFLWNAAFPAAAIAHAFAWSALLTAVAFFAVGSLKSKVVGQRWWRGGLETLLVGGAAAAVAYLIGLALEGVA